MVTFPAFSLDSRRHVLSVWSWRPVAVRPPSRHRVPLWPGPHGCQGEPCAGTARAGFALQAAGRCRSRRGPGTRPQRGRGPRVPRRRGRSRVPGPESRQAESNTFRLRVRARHPVPRCFSLEQAAPPPGMCPRRGRGREHLGQAWRERHDGGPCAPRARAPRARSVPAGLEAPPCPVPLPLRQPPPWPATPLSPSRVPHSKFPYAKYYYAALVFSYKVLSQSALSRVFSFFSSDLPDFSILIQLLLGKSNLIKLIHINE